MELKEAFEILGLKGNEDFKTISETYYDLLKKLWTKNEEQMLEFEEEGKKITKAYFLIWNTPNYQKEKALINFRNIIRNYELSDEEFKKVMEEVMHNTYGK